VDAVRLISEDGKQLGVVPIREALEKAKQVELDLVEVAPEADPPVCRITDFGKILYEKKRRAKEAKRKQKHIEIKEIKIRPNIDQHDLSIKIKHAKDFLIEGNKVKFTLVFRGREMMYMEQAKLLMNKIIETLADTAVVENEYSLVGKTMSIVLGPKT